MKMSDVQATGSGGSRAEDSEARPQVAGYGARPGGRPRRPGRAKPQRHILNKERILVKCVWRGAVVIDKPLLLAFYATA